MSTFFADTEYYFCPDYNIYAKREGGMYYWIKDGIEEPNHYLFRISLSEIYAEDISKEEYYAQLKNNN